MFDVTKALKKLIECSIGDGTNHCNGYVTFAELNAIFEAGHDDEFDLLEFQRGYFSGHKDAMKEIEERLARLEKSILHQDKLIHPVEKPVTNEKCECHAWNPIYKHGKIVRYDCENCNVSQPIMDDKPSEFISIPRDVAEEWLKAHKDDTRAFCFMWDEVRKALEG